MRFFVKLLIVFLLSTSCYATRIKDITSLSGVRDNPLIGYGLVVGLDGTGDRTNQAPFTEQSFRNMLLEFGVRLPKTGSMQLRNVAAVAVSATLPPFARIGQKIDITVSSLGNATSLRGGNLLLLPLKGADNQVYGMAQGSVVVSGFGANGADGSKVSVNSTGTGRIPNGATVEQVVEMPYVQNGVITFELTQPDFTTAQRIADVINRRLRQGSAHAIDAGAVAVQVDQAISKENYFAKNSYVAFISELENLDVEPGIVAARVVVNSRSGTIVAGQHVTISPVAVTHGNLSVSITETQIVSQPAPLSNGKTVKTTLSDVKVDQEKKRAFVLGSTATLKDLVDAINRVGTAPGDLIAILEAVKQSGALHAELEII